MPPSWLLVLLAVVSRASYLNCWLGEGERGKMTGGGEEGARPAVVEEQARTAGEEEQARTAGEEEQARTAAEEEEEARTARLRQELESWFSRMLREQFPFPTAPEGLQEEDVLDLEDVRANMTGFFELEVGMVFSNMSSSPTGYCAVQYAMWKRRGALPLVTGLTNSSDNYLLLGFLLAMHSQSLLLLVRQAGTQDDFSISVSYRSSNKVK
jgi:hypothetical protein